MVANPANDFELADSDTWLVKVGIAYVFEVNWNVPEMPTTFKRRIQWKYTLVRRVHSAYDEEVPRKAVLQSYSATI